MDDSWKKKSDFESRRLSIIDFSSEDDSLLGSAPGFLQDDASSDSLGQKSTDLFQHIDENKLDELFESVEANKLQEIPESDEFVPQPSQCLEPQLIRKNGKCNLRKSLAWDSAFFTCEGIMDAEELSTMISFDKSQKKMLPGIQEEVNRSTDSISTLESDTLTLESVESSLFDDVRASIQRSRKPDKVIGENSKVGSGLRESKVSSVLKKVESASQPKLKPKVAPKKPSLNMQNPAKLPRPVRAAPQPVAASREPTSSVLRRSKVVDKPIPSSTRVANRASTGGDFLKPVKESTKVISGRGVPMPKLPNSLRNVPRPSKSSSTTTTGPASSIDSSGSNLSIKSGISPSNSMKKTVTRTGNPTSSTRSSPKTRSRVDNNIDSGKFRVSAQSLPSPMHSSNVSPASSLSDWSVESSVSSISSSQQISFSSRESLSRSYSSKRVPMEFDSAYCVDHDDKTSAGSAFRGSSGQGTLKASAEMVSLDSTSKPSGLRLPSPKIGFFDGGKSASRTPKRNLQSNSAAPSNLPKSGASSDSVSPRGSGIKVKLGKTNPEKGTLISAKHDAQAQPRFSNMKPKVLLSPEASKPATEEVKICHAPSPLQLKLDKDDNKKCEEVRHGVYDAGSWNNDIGFTENDDTADFLKAELEVLTEFNAQKDDVKIAGLRDTSSASKFENVVCLEELAKDANRVGGELKTGNEKAESMEVGNDELENEATDVLKTELSLETEPTDNKEDVKIAGLSDSPAANFEDMTCAEELAKGVNHELKNIDEKSDDQIGCLIEQSGSIEVTSTKESDLSPVNNFKSATCSKESDKDSNLVVNELKNGNEKSESEDQIDCLVKQSGSTEVMGTEGRDIIHVFNFENVACSEELAKDANCVGDGSKNSNEKYDFEDQVEFLIRHLGSMEVLGTGNVTCSEELDKVANHVGDELKNGDKQSEFEDEIDCLVRQLGSLEIKDTEGTLFDKIISSDHKVNSVADSFSKNIVTASPPSDSTDSSCKRIPFSVKDSLCNIGVSESEKNRQVSPFSEEHFDREQLLSAD